MPRYYLLDENNNLIEVENVEGNFYKTTLEKLHSELNGTDHRIEFVSQAQYNQLAAQGRLVANTYYFITDDETAEGLEESIQKILDGTYEVGVAEFANGAVTDFTNAQLKHYDYGYHQDGYYATIPANENEGEGYYWWGFSDASNHEYGLGIVHRFGTTTEILRSPTFLCNDPNDNIRLCCLHAQEQNDGSLKIWCYAQRPSAPNYMDEFELDECCVYIKKIR